ncbi:hypothetical protein B5E92_15115, partial [Erysipelatoclostridium sp. An15]|uniref:SpaA isopeptide-forming pilin-related protein n=1 Tax=Erysipelatoclostridium sp. An15 TaxID=1965566 RepID=UPI000B3AE455
TFYLSAPLTVTENYSSDWLTANNLLKYAPLVIQGYANYQSEGTLSLVKDPQRAKLNIDWMDTGSLKLTKTNDTGELIDGSEFNLKHTSLDYSIDLKVKDGQITANNLPVGEYILTETVVPPGHVAITKTFKVTINSNETTEEVVVNNLRPVGNLIINKQLEQSDNINLADYDFSKVKFKITASEKINDSVTNQKLYEKGDAITTGSGKGSSEDYVKLISGNELGNGIYTPDENGKLELTGMPMGSYNIEEIECPDGFVFDDEMKTVTFTQQDFVTLTYTTSLDINNEITKTEFSKTDVGGEAIVGAFVQILDDEKNVVYEFTTSDQPIQIDGLKDGKYYFHEDLAPLGYNLANDVEFTVSNGEIQKVHIVDTITTVSKLKEDGSLLQGAELEIVSTKTKNIVDKWTTGQHIFDITDEIRTELENGNTVTGTYNESENKITYKITPNSNHDDYTIMIQTDNETVYHNIDINGNETTHLIQNLISGQEYILRESKTPDGYATAPEQKFVAGTDKNVNLTMTDEDTKVEISKQDITTQKELEGAHLQVKDKNGNIVDEWVSGKEPHIIKNLTVNETYTLIETIAPVNYQIAQSIQFTIEDTGDVQNVVMYDELMPVAKNVKTSDDNNMLLFGTVCLISLAGVIAIARKKKHN